MGSSVDTVTFLFTDIEGSTARWQHDDRAMSKALAAHDKLIRAVVEGHGGAVFKHTGDGICAVFPSAGDAVAAAVDAQAGLKLPVRMGLHTGEAETRDGDFFGSTLNVAARVMDAGHSGQVLVSSATASLVRGVELLDLGEHRLKGLEATERIFQVGRRAFPALRTPSAAVGNLPNDLSSFVGREREVHSLRETLTSHRLVTLIGVGGTGKTRLALETARTVSTSFPHGCWLIELATITAAEAVLFTVAAGLGITTPVEGDIMSHLVTRLREQRVLIVLDNCEHLLDAVAEVVERLVATCPHVTVLATSREPLMIRGEHLVPVSSLSRRDSQQLFFERARDEAPDLEMGANQATAVAELCERLDGLPLALELAASRVRAFTPVELAADLDERFRMLVGGRRSRAERHQTMRGTLDWSYELCSAGERAVFDRLSVFLAPFDLAAARAVAADDDLADADVVEIVLRLVDRSLLQRATAADGTTRYRMLETIRAYGRQHLHQEGTADQVRARHARHVGASMGALALRWYRPDEDEVDRRLDEFVADARVALDWCIDQREWELGLVIASNLSRSSERAMFELLVRLHDAARAGGAPVTVLDELSVCDPRTLMAESVQQLAERGWSIIRTGQTVPSDRFSFPPQLLFNNGGVAAADVDEFVESLQPWLVAPTSSRVFAHCSVVRALAQSGHLDAAERLLDDLAEFTAGLDSVAAARLVAGLRGTVARMRLDWTAAAAAYAQAVDVLDGSLQGVVDLSAAWHLLTARCLGSGPIELTGAELREPWRCLVDGQLDIQRWHGAVASAIALHRLGHTSLADRFIAWAQRDDPLDVVGTMFGDVLHAAGLPTAEGVGDDDLPCLLGELRAIASQLDA
jgi:predicted ATPase